MYGYAALACTVLMTVALFRKDMVAACVSALGVGTAGLLWVGDPSKAAISTTWWIILLVATTVALLFNYFKLTRVAVGLFAYFLLTGLVLWQGLGAFWAFVLLAIAAVAAMFEANRRSHAWKAVALVAVILAMGAAVVPSFSGVAVAAEQPGDPHSLAIQPGDLLPDAAKCGADDKFNRNSMPDTKGRVWSDSVSTPFKATDKDAQFKELTSEICVNPVLGDAYAQALGDAKIGDFSVLGANPWLHDFLQKSGGKDGLKVWLTHKASDTKTIYVTKSYQDNAQMVNALLFALDKQGTETAPSTVNWPLGALVADNLPRVYKETSKDKQENQPFMALTFTQKAGGCPYVLGVNVKDKRPENVSCETAVKVAPKKPTPPRLTVTPPGKPTPKTTPTKPGHTPSSPPPSSHTPPPKSCPSGQTGTPPNCLEIKDPKPIPSNSNHTPATVTESAKPPVHPSETAKPSKPGSGSTQPAEGSTAAPKPTKSVPAPEVSNDPTKPAEGCTNPVTGEAC